MAISQMYIILINYVKDYVLPDCKYMPYYRRKIFRKNWWSEVSGREGIFTQTNMDDLQGGETIQHSTATLDTWNICQNLKKREH